MFEIYVKRSKWESDEVEKVVKSNLFEINLSQICYVHKKMDFFGRELSIRKKNT